MADPQIRQVPVEFSLELMTVVSTHRVNTEGKLRDNMVNKFVGTGVPNDRFQALAVRI